MNNDINYYYGIKIDNLSYIDSNLLFQSNDEYYYLEKVNYNDKRIKEVYELNKKMINNGILIHEIVLNNFNHIVSVINNKEYILMRIYVNLNIKVTMDDILYFHRACEILVTNKLNTSFSFSQKWSKKIDYYEQQAIEIGKKYPIAIEAFNYFVGIGENAISYFNNIEGTSTNVTFSHIRVNNNPLDFYNPFNITLDYKIRDISEFLKYNFFYGNIDFNKIKNYFLNSNFSSIDIKYFYSRMLFPTFYFDVFERIMENLEDEKNISIVIKNIGKYEKFLYDLYLFFSKKYNLEEIEWLKKVINQY